MRKLALSDDILMKIEKPARYIGGEVNCSCKRPSERGYQVCNVLPGCL